MTHNHNNTINKNSKISVLAPCYNSEKWISKSLSRMSQQTVSNLQIIVIDYGPSDNSKKIINTHAQIDHRIKPIYFKNAGIVHVLNQAIDIATGDFIARMDADDISEPNRFKNQLAFMESTGVDLCGSWFSEFGQGLLRKVRWPHTEPAVRAAMLFQNSICHPTVIPAGKSLTITSIVRSTYLQKTMTFLREQVLNSGGNPPIFS